MKKKIAVELYFSIIFPLFQLDAYFLRGDSQFKQLVWKRIPQELIWKKNCSKYKPPLQCSLRVCARVAKEEAWRIQSKTKFVRRFVLCSIIRFWVTHTTTCCNFEFHWATTPLQRKLRGANFLITEITGINGCRQLHRIIRGLMKYVFFCLSFVFIASDSTKLHYQPADVSISPSASNFERSFIFIFAP